MVEQKSLVLPVEMGLVYVSVSITQSNYHRLCALTSSVG